MSASCSLLNNKPGADHAHLPAQHVDELGQLVEARLAQESPQPGHPGVVFQLEGLRPFAPRRRVALQDLFQLAVGVHAHGAGTSGT